MVILRFLMIKLKKLLKEASVSPSYSKFINGGWKILETILGPNSEEYWTLMKSREWNNFWDGLRKGDPKAGKEYFLSVSAKIDQLMKRRIKKIEKEVKDHKKRMTQGMVKFMRTGKKFKV